MYSFDDYDNLLSMSAASYTYTMDSATNQIASVVIGGNTYPLQYDDRGFVSGFVGNQMDYDPFGQMTRYEDPTAGLEAHYFYNAATSVPPRNQCQECSEEEPCYVSLRNDEESRLDLGPDDPRGRARSRCSRSSGLYPRTTSSPNPAGKSRAAGSYRF